MPSPDFSPDRSPRRLLADAERAAGEQARAELFFREFALDVARKATTEFGKTRAAHGDGAAAVNAYLRHEEASGRMSRNEVTASGRGFHVHAKVRSCAFQATCQNNLHELGEVPQCVRAITLIQAISARVAERPPLTYDLQPGLVDGTRDACTMRLRPAATSDFEPIAPTAHRR